MSKSSLDPLPHRAWLLTSPVQFLGGAPDPGPGAPTIHIRAFWLVGGIRIRRDGPGRRPAAERLDRGTDRRAELLDRRAERRSRRGRYGGM